VDVVISSQSEETMTVLHLLSYNPCCTSYTTQQKFRTESFGKWYPKHGIYQDEKLVFHD